jgi:hypothetical protein
MTVHWAKYADKVLDVVPSTVKRDYIVRASELALDDGVELRIIHKDQSKLFRMTFPYRIVRGSSKKELRAIVEKKLTDALEALK